MRVQNTLSAPSDSPLSQKRPRENEEEALSVKETKVSVAAEPPVASLAAAEPPVASLAAAEPPIASLAAAEPPIASLAAAETPVAAPAPVQPPSSSSSWGTFEGW